jgi:HAD superfamily hydrolase (TIGR01509 family)
MASQFFESVLFDMDGLTINSEPEWLEAEREVTASFGYTWTKEDQAHCLGGPLHKVGEYMSKVTNSSEPGDYFHKKLVDLMTEKITISASFMPGARELIRNLHLAGVPMALVSASPRALVDAALSHVKPIPFKATISSDDVLNTKPDPEGYLKAARMLDVDIRNSLILEDSATGVAAARASGARVIAVPHLVEIEADHQTKVINSLEELSVDLLREWFINW